MNSWSASCTCQLTLTLQGGPCRALFLLCCSATTVYGMLLLDVALYFALLWYLDKVRGSQGVVWMIL